MVSYFDQTRLIVSRLAYRIPSFICCHCPEKDMVVLTPCNDCTKCLEQTISITLDTRLVSKDAMGFNIIFVSSTIPTNKWQIQRRALVPLPVLIYELNGDDVTIRAVLTVGWRRRRRGIVAIGFIATFRWWWSGILIKCQVCLQVGRVHFLLEYFAVITGDVRYTKRVLQADTGPNCCDHWGTSWLSPW